jgi:hypothetical protein
MGSKMKFNGMTLKIDALNFPIFLKKRQRITNFALRKKLRNDKNYTS